MTVWAHNELWMMYSLKNDQAGRQLHLSKTINCTKSFKFVNFEEEVNTYFDVLYQLFRMKLFDRELQLRCKYKILRIADDSTTPIRQRMRCYECIGADCYKRNEY